MPELLIRTLVVPVTAEQIFPNVMQIAENLKLLQATHQFVHRNLNAAFVFQNHALINLRDSVIHINDMVLYGFGNFNRLPADSFPFEDLYMFIATLYSHLMHIVHLRPMERQSVKLAPSGYQLLNAFFGGSGPIQSNISTRIQAPQLYSRLDRIFKLKNIRRANNGAFFAAHLDYFNRFVPTEFLTEFNEMNLEDLPEEEAEEEAEEATEEVLEAPLPEPLVSVSPEPEPEPEPEPSPIVVPPRVYRNAPPEPRAYNSYERGNRGRRSRSRSRNRRNEKGHNRERSRNRRNNRGNERGTRNRRGRGNGRGRRK